MDRAENGTAAHDTCDRMMSTERMRDMDRHERPLRRLKERTAGGIPGLAFRGFRDESDYRAMADISFRSWKADDIEFIKTEEDFESQFAADEGADSLLDLLFAEVEGRPVGFSETGQTKDSSGTLVYSQSVHLLPEFRKTGLREAMLLYNEEILAEAAGGRGTTGDGVLQTWAMSEPNDWGKLVIGAGYQPAWHVLEMVRPHLNDIPDAPLPEGAVVRPVEDADHRRVWNASREMFMHQPWSSEREWDDAHFDEWRRSPRFMPHLWQIAWEGDRIIGSVQSFISDEENRAFGRRRGHTETIFVAPEWRGRGLARALIAKSLLRLREEGMEEATLDTEAENIHEAFRVYEGMGYRTVTSFTVYRKPLPPSSPGSLPLQKT